MNATANTTLNLAKTLVHAGFDIRAVEVRTPDGRCWNVAPVPLGTGQRADGSWGPVPGARLLGRFRLFEMDWDAMDGPNEHDADDGGGWTAAELFEYLKAVGTK
ncbi:MAG: hypothetical protein IT438_06785 [Phycisphaerales bacterium]|nr:hypothetical protein [Phycisphaerales bacterium]